MKKLLLSGFEPFLGFPINPTESIVKELDGKVIGNYQVHGLLLLVDFENAGPKILEEMEKVQPDAVISLGLAGGRSSITPERIAVNCRDGEADNRGVALQDSPIYEDGADGYFSTLPIRKMVNVLNENGFPAKVSDTAGTYLCNNVMYTVLHATGKRIPAGFVHIPASHELAVAYKKEMPSWSQKDLTAAIEKIIEMLE
ncbi:pyroglutamyl-peptidase I [Neobacillus sp. D3-1R]|uniref:pyroglutamyl-peptidase I n=1 Tax=Neobacillus sp. D3-1R TaxID=3445778 RepID=UPI003FA14BEC